jgi:hypothetical protein
MAVPNPLNVFKGSDSLAQYFDPDASPPVPLVELPDSLNPLRSDGVRIYAKMLTALPAQNVKSLPGTGGASATSNLKAGWLTRWKHSICFTLQATPYRTKQS